MAMIEVDIITGPIDLETKQWPTTVHYIRAESIELIHEYSETYDKNTCQVLLNTKMPVGTAQKQTTAVGYFALRESPESLTQRLQKAGIQVIKKSEQ